MTNLATTKKTNEISLKGAQDLVVSIKDGLKLVSQGYLAITPYVAKLYDCKGYKALGYQNFDDMCKMEFAMSHGTTVGIRKVFSKFGVITKDNKYIIPDKYLEYGYTKLLLFTDKRFDETSINPLEEFTPDMTIAEMRDRLEKALNKHDDKAIETSAKDVPEDATEDITEDATEDITEDATEDITEDEPATPLDIANEIQSLLSELRKVADVKPEKMALLDNMDATIKEFKKALKK